MKKVIICSLTMGLILLALFCGGAEAEEVRAGVVPPDTSCSPGAQIQVGIEIDVSNTSELLGAYSAGLEWNPAVLEFVEISGGTSEGFTTLQSNQSEVSSGKVLFNQFNALGTGGIVHIARITFMVIGEIGQTAAIDLELSALTAAHTFTNLLSLLTIEDGLITVIATIPDISLSAVSHDFGDVQVNSSASWTLGISNVGDASLFVSNISSSDPQFGASPISFNVATGGSQNVTVAFTPTSMGDKTGTLTISSSDPDESTVTVSLSGKGLLPDGTDCGSDYYEDWVFYCDGDNVRKHKIFHDFYYEGGSCKDHTSWVDDQFVENCNDHDAWVDTGDRRWIDDPDSGCKEKEQKKRQYRNYTCSDGSCSYSVTNTTWADTGNKRNKSDGTDCGSDGWVDTGNTKWVTTQAYEGKEDQRERKERQYRDYYCSGGSCTYQVTDTHWVDTGNTRTVNKSDGTDCGTDGWYDTEETRWIDDPDHPDSKKEQRKQEQRDHFCSEGSCVYEVADTNWIDTGWREYAFQTTDHAVKIKMDTTWHDSPDTLKWEDETDHGIEVLSVQNISDDSRYKFTNWSGKSTSTDTVISIHASAEDAGTYIANYKTQYYLTVETDPLGIATLRGEGWYDGASPADIGEASSQFTRDGITYCFAGWTVNDIPISDNPPTVTMDSPKTAIAHYEILLTVPPIVDMPDTISFQQDSFFTVNLDTCVSDRDHLDSEISWSYSGNVYVRITLDPTTRIATFIAEPDWYGEESIIFTATDPVGASDRDTTIVRAIYEGENAHAGLSVDVEIQGKVESGDQGNTGVCCGPFATVVLSFYTKEVSNLIGNTLSVKYDSAFVSYDRGSFSSFVGEEPNVLLPWNPIMVGPAPHPTDPEIVGMASMILWNFPDAEEAPDGDGHLLAVLQFTTKAGFKTGDEAEFWIEEITYKGVDGVSCDLKCNLDLSRPITVIRGLLGDFNNDCKVWLDDFSLFVRYYGLSEGHKDFVLLYDLDGDGHIGLGDFSIFAGNYGESIGSAKAIPMTEEEASLSWDRVDRSEETSGDVKLQVRLDGVKELKGYSFKVRYDPDRFDFRGAKRVGSGFSDDGNNIRPLLVVSPTVGEVIVADAVQEDAVMKGAGVLVELCFQCKGASENFRFTVTEGIFLDAEGELHALRSATAVSFPQGFAPLQSSPNPFNASTAIRYRLAETSEIRLSLYNLLGQEVRRLMDGEMPAGAHLALWDGRDDSGRPMASGVYLCRFRAEDFTQTKRIVLLR